MSTAPPTTSPPTTSAPTTLAPTTTLTTLAPTTAPPTVMIDLGHAEMTLGLYMVHQPGQYVGGPAEIVEAKNYDQWARLGPAEMTISAHGATNQNVGILLGKPSVTISAVGDAIDIGQVITLGAATLYVTNEFDDFLLTAQESCNWVKWSKIGRADFTISHSNEAGERPLDWNGCVRHLLKFGDKVVAYGDNGVSFLFPKHVHWGLNTIYRLGIKNQGAVVGTDDVHFFIDVTGQLWRLGSKGLQLLDYKEFLSSMGTVILSYDPEQSLLYICDGTDGYIYSDRSNSFGEGPPNVTGLGAKTGNLFVVSNGAINTPAFQVKTDVVDLGTRKFKTIERVEVGTEVTEFLEVSMEYRKSYRDEFKQIPWFIVNHDGIAYPKCYGVEFRVLVRANVYEYLELDYLKLRGRIHGFSYLDTTAKEGRPY